MPIYEYLCNDCDTKFELIRPVSRFSEPGPCPTCQKDANRIVSRFACFSTDEGGAPVAVGGGGGCSSSCSSSSCGTCGV